MIDNVIFAKDENVYFLDTKDHFENSFLRLMDLNYVSGKDFIEIVGEFINFEFINNPIEQIKTIKKAWCKSYPKTQYGTFNQSYELILNDFKMKSSLLTKLSHDTSYGVAYDSSLEHGWLVALKQFDGLPKNVIEYEQKYFHEGEMRHGYGNYLNQTWRKEKATRMVMELRGELNKLQINLESMYTLDVGCGYGDFLHAMRLANVSCEGLEISSHATDVCKSKGLFVSNLNIIEFSENNSTRFDLVTMWDVIEHVNDPLKYLLAINKVIKKKAC